MFFFWLFRMPLRQLDGWLSIIQKLVRDLMLVDMVPDYNNCGNIDLFSEPRLRYTFKDINFTVYMLKDIDLILFFLCLTYYYYYLLIIIMSST